MQMKLDEQRNPDATGDKDSKQLNHKPSITSTTGLEKLNETPMSSTIKSLELPPKEYEQQLQLYESEVRNHIKCEQQLKLHIEVLQEKIDELEKEKITTVKEHEK